MSEAVIPKIDKELVKRSMSLKFLNETVGVIEINTPDKSVNVLSLEALQTLDDCLNMCLKRPKLDFLIIKSGKPNTFVAGADINEINQIKSPELAADLLTRCHEIFHKLSTLPAISIALIHGVCLGGGLELALACDFRLVSDSPKTQLGLPEVKLGIIPGFGGTQRLPRLIELPKALDMILTGKSVDAKKAVKIGLADAIIPHRHLDKAAQDFIAACNSDYVKQIKKKRQAKHSSKQELMHPIICHMAKKQILKKGGAVYPAPLVALDLIRRTRYKSLEKGLEEEIKSFTKLVGTPLSKTLIHIFFGMENLKGQGENVPSKPSKKAAVLGAGFMGGGIGWALAQKDISVRLKDISWDPILMAINHANSIFKKGVKRRKLTKSEADLHALRISGTLDYSGFQDSDIVFEAIPENMALKQSILKELEANIPKDCIIASNTSALSISEMASVLEHPERCVGFHFFSPVHRMPLVEIIPGEKTSQESIDIALGVAKQIGKTAVIVKNCHGFLVNRILLPYVNEAVFCLQDGADMKIIDKIATNFGMPVGPLALADEVGLDVGHKVSQILADGYGNRMRVPDLFDMIKEIPDCLGKKTKLGFYAYTGKVKTPNPFVLKALKQFPKTKPKPKVILDRLLCIMINEAARCIEEGVIAGPSELDMAMVLGTGFPPHRGGLAYYVDTVGVETIVDTMLFLSETVSSRFYPCQLLLDMKKDKSRFYPAS